MTTTVQIIQTTAALGVSASAWSLVAARGWLSPRSLESAPPRQTGLSPWDMLFGVCLILVGAVVTGAVNRMMGLPEHPSPQVADTFAVQALLTQGLSMGPAVAFALTKAAWVRDGFANLGLIRRPIPNLGRGILSVLVAVPMVMGVLLGVALLSDLFWVPPPPVGHDLLEAMRNTRSPLVLGGLLFSAIALAPFVEEVIFRGLVQTSLLSLPGAARHRWVIVLCAAGIFTLIHIGGVPWQGLPAIFCLGAILGWLYERTGSLIPGMVLHAGFNAVNVLVVLAGKV